MSDVPSRGPYLPYNHPRYTRRQFVQGSVLLGAGAMTGALLRGRVLGAPAVDDGEAAPDMRQGGADLVVQPVLTYDVPTRREATSWRNWGGVHTTEAAAEEAARITAELGRLQARADFGLRFLPIVIAANPAELGPLENAKADAIALYPAGGWLNLVDPPLSLDCPSVCFVRRHSGPYYLWDEIVHSRLLRAHGDRHVHTGLGVEDIVVDDPSELLWRFRALYGLHNTTGRRIVCIGGPDGWSTPDAPENARQRFGLDMVTVPIPEVEGMIEAGRGDAETMQHCRRMAEAYLGAAGVTLKTSHDAVVDAFLLKHVFGELMARHEAQAVTTNRCMASYAKIMPCLTLGLLNDAGLMAYCESDFVVIPSGILMHFISGQPAYLCNPTFPFNDRMLFAHCAAPRRMDGKRLEPVDLVTHYESDHGAASHVHFRKGQLLTVVKPDFEARRWLAFTATIIATPELPTCRAQIEVDLNADALEVARNLRGFHCMLTYGDHTREVAYAAAKAGIETQCLSDT